MKKSLLAMAVVAMVGCASNPDVAKIEAMEVAKDIKQSEAKAVLEQVPDWFIKPPVADGYGMFGVGAGKSSDMQHAFKKARLHAEFQLVSKYKQEISGSERSYEKEGPQGELVSSGQYLIDKIIDSVPLVGYDLVDQKVFVDGNGDYQAFTLLKLPFDEFNKVLKKMSMESHNQDEKDAFAELERRLDKRRELAEKKKQQAFEQKKALIDLEIKTRPAEVEDLSDTKPADKFGSLFK